MNQFFKHIVNFLAGKSNFFNENFGQIESILQRFLNFFKKLIKKLKFYGAGS